MPEAIKLPDFLPILKKVYPATYRELLADALSGDLPTWRRRTENSVYRIRIDGLPGYLETLKLDPAARNIVMVEVEIQLRRQAKNFRQK